jgi:hypothetical protein
MMKLNLSSLKPFLFIGLVCFSSACMRMKSTGVTAKKAPAEYVADEEIEVFVSKPVNRHFQEAMHYEIIGSNLVSYDRLLNRVKSQARKDGCEALVQVKFYKQQYSKIGSAFPAIEAVGVRYVD